jgi:hypothetical protein
MAAEKIYKGKEMRLRFGEKTLYHATSCQLTVSSKTTEVATKDTNGDIVTPDGYTATLSTDSLWADKANGTTTQIDPIDLLQEQLDETLLTFEFTTGVVGDKIVSGSCYVTSTDLGAEVGSNATAAFQFTVSGDITAALVPEE